jgi:acetyl/propionyl-CoA carboxylase alpha subunit
MIAAGVPVVPGATPVSQSNADIAAAARQVGFPILLKAAGGGGGKGMRVVRTGADLDDAIAAARSEAERAFGNGALYVERLIERGRHIEVQLMGDTHGHIVHLFERDCTLQRRHQR